MKRKEGRRREGGLGRGKEEMRSDCAFWLIFAFESTRLEGRSGMDNTNSLGNSREEEGS